MHWWILFFLLYTPILVAKCISGNCQNGVGSAIYPKGDVYTGEWKNGRADGTGRLEYKNGNVYYGDWKNGKANGIGIMLYADKTRYEGEWKDSQAHGYGVFYDPDGKILYDGQWQTGKQTGASNVSEK